MFRKDAKIRPHRPTKHSIRIAGAAFVAALTAAGASAQAQGVGWVLNSKASFSGNLTPAKAFSFNSADNGTGTIAIKHIATGYYGINFADLGDGLHSNVQVSAVGSSNFCTSSGWSSTSNKKNVLVYVRCFKPPIGAAADSLFTVLYTSQNAQLGFTGPFQGYVLADQPSNASYTANALYSYNSNQGTNLITRSATGTYTVHMQYLASDGGIALVSAVSNTAAHCQASQWQGNTVSPGQDVLVLCTNTAGTATDTEFSALFSAGETVAPGTLSSHGASGLYGLAPSAAYAPLNLFFQFNNLSTAPVEGKQLSTGHFELQIPRAAKYGISTAIVATVDTSGYCNVASWALAATTVDVNCYTYLGVAQNGNFTIAFQTATVP
jgi:hypothetical protein